MSLTNLSNLIAEGKVLFEKLETALGILGPVAEALDPAAAPIVEGVEAVATAVEGVISATTTTVTAASPASEPQTSAP